MPNSMMPRKPASRKEGAQHLVAHQGPEDGARPVGEHAPVGAELVAHHDPGHDAHRERDREDLHPVAKEPEVDVAARDQPDALQKGEVAGEPDREGGEQDVERDRERELEAREHQGIGDVGQGCLRLRGPGSEPVVT
jgi:hypothetical protein